MSENNDPFLSGDSLQKLVDKAKKQIDRKSEQAEDVRPQDKREKTKHIEDVDTSVIISKSKKKVSKGIEKRCLVCVGESQFLALRELVVLEGILGSPTTLKSCLDKMISEYLNTHEKEIQKLKKEASREISRL